MNNKTWREVADKGYLSSLYLLDREDDRGLNFHGAFIPQVAEALILRHTKPGDWVWDPMCGSGTTGIVARKLGRHYLLSDLNPLSAAEKQAGLIFRADARCDPAPMQTFDLVILHPPYHNIIRFSDKPEDLSNAGSVAEFLEMFSEVVANVSQYLRPGGYIGLVIGDIWENGNGVVPLGFYCMKRALEIVPGAQLKAIVVKDIRNNRFRANRRNLWLSRYYRWGTVEFAHEYIFSIRRGR